MCDLSVIKEKILNLDSVFAIIAEKNEHLKTLKKSEERLSIELKQKAGSYVRLEAGHAALKSECAQHTDALTHATSTIEALKANLSTLKAEYDLQCSEIQDAKKREQKLTRQLKCLKERTPGDTKRKTTAKQAELLQRCEALEASKNELEEANGVLIKDKEQLEITNARLKEENVRLSLDVDQLQVLKAENERLNHEYKECRVANVMLSSENKQLQELRAKYEKLVEVSRAQKEEIAEYKRTKKVKHVATECHLLTSIDKDNVKHIAIECNLMPSIAITSKDNVKHVAIECNLTPSTAIIRKDIAIECDLMSSLVITEKRQVKDIAIDCDLMPSIQKDVKHVAIECDLFKTPTSVTQVEIEQKRNCKDIAIECDLLPNVPTKEINFTPPANCTNNVKELLENDKTMQNGFTLTERTRNVKDASTECDLVRNVTCHQCELNRNQNEEEIVIPPRDDLMNTSDSMENDPQQIQQNNLWENELQLQPKLCENELQLQVNNDPQIEFNNSCEDGDIFSDAEIYCMLHDYINIPELIQPLRSRSNSPVKIQKQEKTFKDVEIQATNFGTPTGTQTTNSSSSFGMQTSSGTQTTISATSSETQTTKSRTLSTETQTINSCTSSSGTQTTNSGTSLGTQTFTSNCDRILQTDNKHPLFYDDTIIQTNMSVINGSHMQKQTNVSIKTCNDIQTQTNASLISGKDIQTQTNVNVISGKDIQTQTSASLISGNNMQTQTNVSVNSGNDIQTQTNIHAISACNKEIQTCNTFDDKHAVVISSKQTHDVQARNSFNQTVGIECVNDSVKMAMNNTNFDVEARERRKNLKRSSPKISLRNAVNTLKRSKVDITLKAGRLIRYNKQTAVRTKEQVQRRMERNIMEKMIGYFNERMFNRVNWKEKLSSNSASDTDKSSGSNMRCKKGFDSGYMSSHDCFNVDEGALGNVATGESIVTSLMKHDLFERVCDWQKAKDYVEKRQSSDESYVSNTVKTENDIRETADVINLQAVENVNLKRSVDINCKKDTVAENISETAAIINRAVEKVNASDLKHAVDINHENDIVAQDVRETAAELNRTVENLEESSDPKRTIDINCGNFVAQDIHQSSDVIISENVNESSLKLTVDKNRENDFVAQDIHETTAAINHQTAAVDEHSTENDFVAQNVREAAAAINLRTAEIRKAMDEHSVVMNHESEIRKVIDKNATDNFNTISEDSMDDVFVHDILKEMSTCPKAVSPVSEDETLTSLKKKPPKRKAVKRKNSDPMDKDCKKICEERTVAKVCPVCRNELSADINFCTRCILDKAGDVNKQQNFTPTVKNYAANANDRLFYLNGNDNISNLLDQMECNVPSKQNAESFASCNDTKLNTIKQDCVESIFNTANTNSASNECINNSNYLSRINTNKQINTTVINSALNASNFCNKQNVSDAEIQENVVANVSNSTGANRISNAASFKLLNVASSSRKSNIRSLSLTSKIASSGRISNTDSSRGISNIASPSHVSNIASPSHVSNIASPVMEHKSSTETSDKMLNTTRNNLERLNEDANSNKKPDVENSVNNQSKSKNNVWSLPPEEKVLKPKKEKNIPKRKRAYIPWDSIKTAFHDVVRFKGVDEYTVAALRTFQLIDKTKLMSYFLHEVIEDECEVQKGQSPFEPFLSVTQRTVIGLLLHMEKAQDAAGVVDDFLTVCEQQLLFRKNDPLDVEKIAKIYAAICKMRHSKKRLKRLLLDGLFFMGDSVLPLIYYTLTSWLQVLKRNDSINEDIKDVFSKIIFQTVMTKSNTVNEYCLNSLKNTLQIYYKYPREKYSENDLSKEFLECYMCTLSKKYALAILILYKNNKKEWINRQIALLEELIQIVKTEDVVLGLKELLQNARKLVN